MIKKIFYTILVVFLFVACKQQKEKLEILEINNQELKIEISHFIQRMDTTVKYKYITWVECNEINDTLFEYSVYPNSTFAFLDVNPFHFVCSVDNHPVFFAIKSLSKAGPENPYFKLKKEVVMDLIKQNFPEEYNELIKKKDNQLYLPNIPNEYPETLKLIFTNGKLTSKKIGHGL